MSQFFLNSLKISAIKAIMSQFFPVLVHNGEGNFRENPAGRDAFGGIICYPLAATRAQCNISEYAMGSGVCQSGRLRYAHAIICAKAAKGQALGKRSMGSSSGDACSKAMKR